MNKFSIFVFLCGIASITGQQTHINCVFANQGNIYTCNIAGTSLIDNPSALITIGGFHIGGRTNDMVNRVQITASNIPFIITQLFTTFVNLQELSIINGGLLRVQSGAFLEARSIRTVTMSGNLNLRTLEPNAFTGAQNLQQIDILVSQIDNIPSTAFLNLSNLRVLSLDNNRINEIHPDAFETLQSLQTVSLSNNQLHTLPGRLFANNRNIIRIDLPNNQINAIGRSFLDGLNSLHVFGFLSNRCASNFWIVGTTTTVDTIRDGLTVCFNNSIEIPDETTTSPLTTTTNLLTENEVRRFVLELRGSLVIRDENGVIVGEL